MASVFLSHSGCDGQIVEEIAAFLSREKHRVFLDRHRSDGIHPGEDWEQVLYDRLHSADVLVAVLTSNYVASEWCFAEVAVAKTLGHMVLPVRVEVGASHPLLDSVQFLDYLSDRELARVTLGDRLRAIDGRGGAAWDPEAEPVPWSCRL